MFQLLNFSRIWRLCNYLIFITLTKFWFYFHFYRKSRQEIHATFFFNNGKFSNRSNATFQNTVSPRTIALIGLISELLKESIRFCKHKGYRYHKKNNYKSSTVLGLIPTIMFFEKCYGNKKRISYKAHTFLALTIKVIICFTFWYTLALIWRCVKF